MIDVAHEIGYASVGYSVHGFANGSASGDDEIAILTEIGNGDELNKRVYFTKLFQRKH